MPGYVTKKHSEFIMVNSPAPLEVLEMVVEELHAHRPHYLKEDDVEIQVEAIEESGQQLLKISMNEK